MKKYLYIAIAAATLASCSQDEVIEISEKQAITFGEAFVGNSTRAVDPSYGETANMLTDFNVWGSVEGTNSGTKTWVPIFVNDNVHGNDGVGANKVWNCTTRTQYWIPEASYKFAAVVYDNATVDFGTLTDGLPTQVTFTSNDQTDLLYAYQTATGAKRGETNPYVNFEFAHMLSKAVVTVSNTTDTKKNTESGDYVQSGYFYKVSNVKFLNVNKKGTCKFTNQTNKWDGNTLTSPSDVVFGNITNAEQTSTSTDAVKILDKASKWTSHYERMIIPQTFTSLGVQFTLALYMTNNSEEVLISEETLTKYVENFTFTEGCSYSFNIEVGVGSPIQFTVTSHPSWTEVTPGTTITVQ